MTVPDTNYGYLSSVITAILGILVKIISRDESDRFNFCEKTPLSPRIRIDFAICEGIHQKERVRIAVRYTDVPVHVHIGVSD